RPARITTISLLSCLLKKFSSLRIEDPFMRGAAVATHQCAAGGFTMSHGQLGQGAGTTFQRRVEYDSYIHHYVDEVRVWPMEGTQAAGAFDEPQGKRFTSVDYDVLECLVRRTFTRSCFIPTLVSSVIEDETKVVHFKIVFSRLKCF